MNKTIWLTGLPCSGKTTIGKKLVGMTGWYHLDGDQLRGTSISSELGFSLEDRELNLKRAAQICKFVNDSGNDVIATFISPTEKSRNIIKDILGESVKFVYVKCGAKECERRDVKGMWAKARQGIIKKFTGLDSPFEEPSEYEIAVNTENETVTESTLKIFRHFNPDPNRMCVFIGRYSPFHKGHKHIIDHKLSEGKKVVVMVRERPLDDGDPWTAVQRKKMIDAAYVDNPDVKVVVIPDVEAVCIGRKVGYDIEEINVPNAVKLLSGTNLREKIMNDEEGWELDVDEKVIPVLREFLDG